MSPPSQRTPALRAFEILGEGTLRAPFVATALPQPRRGIHAPQSPHAIPSRVKKKRTCLGVFHQPSSLCPVKSSAPLPEPRNTATEQRSREPSASGPLQPALWVSTESNAEHQGGARAADLMVSENHRPAQHGEGHRRETFGYSKTYMMIHASSLFHGRKVGRRRCTGCVFAGSWFSNDDGESPFIW